VAEREKNGMRVLIVDDERIIADTLSMILAKKGFDARAVYSGEEALEAAPRVMPDVLVSDVVMRGMSGIDAAIQICETVPHCRVILLSGQGGTADLVRQAKSHGREFEILTKPIHPQVLIDRLSSFNAG
jgi:DNA-binding NtrC family response regulator